MISIVFNPLWATTWWFEVQSTWHGKDQRNHQNKTWGLLATIFCFHNFCSKFFWWDSNHWLLDDSFGARPATHCCHVGGTWPADPRWEKDPYTGEKCREGFSWLIGGSGKGSNVAHVSEAFFPTSNMGWFKDDLCTMVVTPSGIGTNMMSIHIPIIVGMTILLYYMVY